MSDTHVTDDAFINSIIGEGTKFKGEFDLNGLLRIDGDFTGVIRTKGKVLVGKNGRAECTLNAGTVVVGGVVRGEISLHGEGHHPFHRARPGQYHHAAPDHRGRGHLQRVLQDHGARSRGQRPRAGQRPEARGRAAAEEAVALQGQKR